MQWSSSGSALETYEFRLNFLFSVLKKLTDKHATSHSYCKVSHADLNKVYGNASSNAEDMFLESWMLSEAVLWQMTLTRNHEPNFDWSEYPAVIGWSCCQSAQDQDLYNKTVLKETALSELLLYSVPDLHSFSMVWYFVGLQCGPFMCLTSKEVCVV